MKVELKNVKYIASMSEETHCFTATIYIDGVKAGEVSNRGQGGPNGYSRNGVEEKLNAYGKTLPPHISEYKDEQGKTIEIPIDADIIIGDLMNAHLAEKELKRSLSKRILFTKLGEAGVYQTSTLSKEVMAKYLQQPEALRKQLKQSDKILNLLPFAEALKIYTEQT